MSLETTAMRPLSSRTQQALDCIKDYLERNGIPPTRAELAEGIGLSDASSVTGHLETLARDGWIQLLPNKKRGIRVTPWRLPIPPLRGGVVKGHEL